MNRQPRQVLALLCLGCFVGLGYEVRETQATTYNVGPSPPAPPTQRPGPCRDCYVVYNGPITPIEGCIPERSVYETSCSGGCYPTTTRRVSVQLSCSEVQPLRHSYTMTATCDNHLSVYYDEVLQASPHSLSTNWPRSATFTIPANVRRIGLMCHDLGLVGGILASFSNGWVTDHTWQCSPLAGRTWRLPRSPAYEIGSHGRAPWHGISGISGRAKWIWTHGWRGQDKMVYCIKDIVAPQPVVSTRRYTYSVIDRCGCPW